MHRFQRTPFPSSSLTQSFAPFEIHIHPRLAQAHWKIAFTEVPIFGRQLTRWRHQALSFSGEAFVLEKEEHMACDVDTGAVFKHPVHCFGCEQSFYFTLRKIAEAKKLACPLCGSDINLADEAYGFVVISVKETIALIDQSSRCSELASARRV
jgi:hypothetical protein